MTANRAFARQPVSYAGAAFSGFQIRRIDHNPRRRWAAPGSRPMIKVQDIVYTIFRAPDLDQMAAFLTDFGMVESERSQDRLSGAAPMAISTSTIRTAIC
jgi:hypothetical protein